MCFACSKNQHVTKVCLHKIVLYVAANSIFLGEKMLCLFRNPTCDKGLLTQNIFALCGVIWQHATKLFTICVNIWRNQATKRFLKKGNYRKTDLEPSTSIFSTVCMPLGRSPTTKPSRWSPRPPEAASKWSETTSWGQCQNLKNIFAPKNCDVNSKW
jgi:hypothetical protein